MPRNPRTSTRGWIVFALLALVVATMGCRAGCPTGQRQICRTENDCRCGAICTVQADCHGTDACVHFANDPNGPGVCADALWALNDPPCLPLCDADQLCVDWGDRPSSCGDTCSQASDCGSGCCLTLQGGQHVCAPADSYCSASCNPPCSTDQVCLATTPPACSNTCSSDADCPGTCCLMLQAGGGACSPHGEFCPTMPVPPCRTVETCPVSQTRFTSAADGAACGTFGSYEGQLANDCTQPIVCRACWWSTAANAYADCQVLGQLPVNATVPLGTTRCADAMLPEPPVKVRCIDVASYQSGNDCLGSGPLP